MTSSDVNMLLEHYKVQVAELSRICGELTRMQHVNNKIIGVLERHIRDDIGNNNTENRSVLGELRDLLHIGEFSKSNVELMVATYNSSPSDEPTLNTVVERENWHRSHEVHAPQSQPTFAPKQNDVEHPLSVREQKNSVKEQHSPYDAAATSDIGSSPSKPASLRHVSISPQKHPDVMSPTRGSAAYSVSPARRNISSASPRLANDEVASSFDENAERDPSPSRADHARSDVSDERHMLSNVPTDRYKAGVISSAELNKLVDELSHVSPSKPRPAVLRPEPRLDKRPDVQVYHAADYEVDADGDSDDYLVRPHTAPAPVLHESGLVVFGPPSIAASVRAKYPDAIVRQSSSRQRLSWLHDPLIQRAFLRLPWLVRGHLTRQLLQTDKVQQLKRIIRDSADIFADLYREIRERSRLQAASSGRVQPAAPPTLTTEQKFLRDRILKQLRAALIDVHLTFHETSEYEQVRLIMQHHVALRERERRSRNLGFDGDSSVEDEVSSPRERLTPRLSAATLKKLEREARERSNSQHNVAHEPATNGMNGGAPRRGAARLTRTRSAGAMENRPRTAPAQARDLPPSRPRNAVVNGNGLDSKSRTVLRNVQQTAVEKDRPTLYRPTHLQLGVKAQPGSAAIGMTYTKSTNAATAAQRVRDRSKSHNIVFDSDGRQ